MFERSVDLLKSFLVGTMFVWSHTVVVFDFLCLLMFLLFQVHLVNMTDFKENEIIHYLSDKKKKIALELLNYGITHLDSPYTLLARMLQLGFLICKGSSRNLLSHKIHVKCM